ncbi:hypothetical protein KKJ10_14330 [Xenorhabdus bovienii]|nr:hypothetical protein [Xenorhabdus bovienii]MDE9491107.1 hypothetical protein [Xenorhabdus bovienii]MDE9507425.1 hypothetical protein [Xenorhabdus bovienii]MDE9548318.1 hypothetical protein [Xenorhabdus bovienii]
MKEGHSLTQRTHTWNKQVYSNKTYIHPETGENFDLSHMTPKIISIKYEYHDERKNKIKGELNVQVIFSYHCYTKSLKKGENNTILVTEYEDGVIKEHRIFDQSRYQYSFTLLGIILNISYKLCRESRIKGKVIRLKEKDKTNPAKGIYIIMKLKAKKEELILYVETAHYRKNEPYNAQLRKETRRFMLILGDMLKEDWNHLVK